MKRQQSLFNASSHATTSSLIAGVDEAGRGALIGNVVAAAVILPSTFNLPKLTDSKKLTAKQRDSLFLSIHEQALAICWAQVGAAEIDAINIHHASLKAMQKAVAGLPITPNTVLIDGKFTPLLPMPSRAIVGGDSLEPAIAAASIIAKVIRDRQMIALGQCYPDYGYERHKGYPSAKHLQAIHCNGIHGLYRVSYRPIRQLCQHDTRLH